MFKKITMAVIMMFCMVSVATATQSYDYITFPEDGIIEVKLIVEPGDEWGIWDTMLYDFTIEDDGNITVNGMIDLFCEYNGVGSSIYLMIRNGVMTNGMPNCPDCNNSLVMTGNNLGIAFEFGSDEDTITDIWYSHNYLNTGTVVDRFSIYEGGMFMSFLEGLTLITWFDDNNDPVGIISMNHTTIPIPGAFWLLAS